MASPVLRLLSFASLAALAVACAGSGAAVDVVEAEALPEVDATPDVPTEVLQDVPADEAPEADEPLPVVKKVFRFAVIADTHIIDEFYEGPESNPLDSETVFLTTERLEAARDALMALEERPEFVLVAGDVVHNYPSYDPAFYDTHVTRFDLAAQLMTSFPVPVHLAWGNHDYDRPAASLELTHALFQSRFGAAPYEAFDHHGWTFLMLDGMLGPTQTPGDPEEGGGASLGDEQLDWLEAQLARGRPTVVVLHHPLFETAETEHGRPGLRSVLRAHADVVKMVFAGHKHMWLDDVDLVWGVPNLVISSTRYDPDAYVVAEADEDTGEVRMLNRDCWAWLSYGSEPWDPVKGCSPAR